MNSNQIKFYMGRWPSNLISLYLGEKKMYKQGHTVKQ